METMRLFWLIATVFFVSPLAAETLSLYGGDRKVLIEEFEYNSGDWTAQVSGKGLQVSDQLEDGLHCISAVLDGKQVPCFSYMDLRRPFHYDLLIYVHNQQVTKLSLVYNKESDGIRPLVHTIAQGPSPPATKLKKVTKTYKDLKKEKQDRAATAQFADNDAESEKQHSWIYNNWKYILLGLFLYNVVVNGGRRAPNASQKEAKQE